MALEPFAIAAACSARGLTPAETRDVEAALTQYLTATAKALNAGQAQRLLEAAINGVLLRSRSLTVFDEKPPAPGDPTTPDGTTTK